MHTGCLVPKGVIHICNDPVTFGEIEDRDGPLPIDADDWPWIQTVRIGGYPSDAPVVGQSRSAGKRQVKGGYEKIEQHFRGGQQSVTMEMGKYNVAGHEAVAISLLAERESPKKDQRTDRHTHILSDNNHRDQVACLFSPDCRRFSRVYDIL